MNASQAHPTVPTFTRSLWPCLAVFAALAAVCLFSGCAHERVVLRAAQTNDVPIVTTNLAPEVVQREIVSTRLNPVPGGPDILTTNLVAETNLVERLETNLIRVITPEVAYTNVSLNPAVGAAVEVGGAMAPVPWAGTAAGIFGTITAGIFGWINNRRRKEALGEAQSWADTSRVLVENVEAVRRQAMSLPGYTEEIDRKVVRGLEAAQRAAGAAVKTRVEGLVENFTENTTDPAPSAGVVPAPGSLAGVPAPVERSAPGQPANRTLSELAAFARSGGIPRRGDFSDSDIASIMEIRAGQA